ncbi:hypothetical protein KIH79_02060 [Bifidobacterium sp. 82T10]|uniref:Transposase n=1 Tax=Bifidobacterium miconis TaxID=2834435 RepID=A0ABS6WCI5_9BIFI|nr:hypothetical protein [Bifidobacterium miconis]MBW3091753.1 hypothetical protein [Bifidobacterium miconis]
MGRTVFTAEEVRYLESLPVVANATAARITYTRAFKRDCLRRYLDGEHAADLFREAGLKPEMIGRKRIERCLARWKAERDAILDDSTGDATASVDAASSTPCASGNDLVCTGDVRDRIIVQQTHYIDALEQEIADLRRRLQE